VPHLPRGSLAPRPHPPDGVSRFPGQEAVSPYWLGVHEAVVDAEVVVPGPSEIAGHGWFTEGELERALRRWAFVLHGVDALRR
jgi:hypothetical protein